jgi:hypothetical protein
MHRRNQRAHNQEASEQTSRETNEDALDTVSAGGGNLELRQVGEPDFGSAGEGRRGVKGDQLVVIGVCHG